MDKLLNITALAEAANGFALNIPISELISVGVVMAGLMILIVWLSRGNIARRLDGSPSRDNCLTIAIPIAMMCLWIFLIAASQLAVRRFVGEEDTERLVFATSASFALVELFMIFLILQIAITSFDMGLKGFGVIFKNILKDISAAFVNYIAVFPLVMFGLWVVVYAATLIKGPDYQFPVNETLDLLSGEGSTTFKVMLIGTAALVVPIFEEFLFRGLFRSTLRRQLESPWTAIILSSIAFVVMHPPMHWLALVPLSVGMGYAYEKSGSLIRSIMIHVIFNSVNIASALLTTS